MAEYQVRVYGIFGEKFDSVEAVTPSQAAAKGVEAFVERWQGPEPADHWWSENIDQIVVEDLENGALYDFVEAGVENKTSIVEPYRLMHNPIPATTFIRKVARLDIRSCTDYRQQLWLLIAEAQHLAGDK